MTREILNQISKVNKINLDYYDHVICTRDLRGKFYITLAVLETYGCERHYCQQHEIVVSRSTVRCVASLLRVDAGILEMDFETEGWERINNLD